MLDEFQPPEGFAFHQLPKDGAPLEEAIRLGSGNIVAAAGGDKVSFAVSVTLHCTAQEARCLPYLAAASLCRAVGSKARIYWPCDVVLEEKPVGSLRARMTDDGIAFLFTVSSENTPPLEELMAPVASDLAALTGEYPANHAERMEDYCRLCLTIMNHVDVVYRGMPLYGFAFAVDKFGSLMVMTQPGKTVVTIQNGPVSIASKDDPGEDLELPAPARI
ncbi:MAG: hypothetical protein LUE22_05940 [Oscillospiraceae bacterium]|nr:hypothetical protein [Oscillospiraceae bacterium]